MVENDLYCMQLFAVKKKKLVANNPVRESGGEWRGCSRRLGKKRKKKVI